MQAVQQPSKHKSSTPIMALNPTQSKTIHQKIRPREFETHPRLPARVMRLSSSSMISPYYLQLQAIKTPQREDVQIVSQIWRSYFSMGIKICVLFCSGEMVKQSWMALRGVCQVGCYLELWGSVRTDYVVIGFAYPSIGLQLGMNSRHPNVPMLRYTTAKTLKAPGKFLATSSGKICCQSGFILLGLTKCKNIWLQMKEPIPQPIMQIPPHIPFLCGKYEYVFLKGDIQATPTKNPKNPPQKIVKAHSVSIKDARITDTPKPQTPTQHKILSPIIPLNLALKNILLNILHGKNKAQGLSDHHDGVINADVYNPDGGIGLVVKIGGYVWGYCAKGVHCAEDCVDQEPGHEGEELFLGVGQGGHQLVDPSK